MSKYKIGDIVILENQEIDERFFNYEEGVIEAINTNNGEEIVYLLRFVSDANSWWVKEYDIECSKNYPVKNIKEKIENMCKHLYT